MIKSCRFTINNIIVDMICWHAVQRHQFLEIHKVRNLFLQTEKNFHIYWSY